MLSVDATGLHIFALTVFWPAIFSVLGVWFAAEIAARLSLRDKRDPIHVWQAMPWIVIIGLIGAQSDQTAPL